MAVYYNDNDPFCCRVLRKQIAAGNLPEGYVDERDIRTVDPAELRRFSQWHLFAGIGGFPLGFRWAGMPDDFPICTGGFPCKQTSTGAAVHGRRKGLAGQDSGLWFELLRIVRLLRPPWFVVENVGGARTWAKTIQGGLEDAGYRISKRPLEVSAKSLGAPHSRRRLFWIADIDGKGLQVAREGGPSTFETRQRRAVAGNPWASSFGRLCGMDDGLPAGVDRCTRIERLGNAVMPIMAQWIGERILAADASAGAGE